MKGSTRQIPGASFIWSCFVQNRAFILCPLKCDFRPLDIAWQPCVRLPRNIATRSRFYSRRSANTYPSLESDHKNDPYHGKTGQHALTSNKIFFSKSPVFAVHRGIVRHLPAEHKIQSLPVRIPPSPPNKNRNFDTMRIKVAVLSCATKALIPRGFWLLSAPAVARQSESLPPAQYAKALGSSRLSFGLWVSFNLWAIVWRLLSQSRKHHCSCDL